MMIATSLPSRVLRYQTPLADAARARTRELMLGHMRNTRLELALLTVIAFGVAFGAALTI